MSSAADLPLDFDLLIRAGRIVCPAAGRDGPGAIALRGDRIAGIGHVTGAARQILEFPEAVVLPGLIDLHAHPAKSGSQFGVDPDQSMLRRGTTTSLSQGDAGAENCERYLRETIAASQTRIRLAINLSSRGESGPGGCFEQLEWCDVAACVAAIERFRPHIWGLAVNCSHHACGATDPKLVLQRGLEAAERSGLPILYGMRRPEDWPFNEQLELLRPGDVVTYCFRRTPHGIVQNGRVLGCVREARSRGVLFDVGHGLGSFDFGTAEAAIQDGFLPDTISTDLQRGHLGREPIHDLPLVMSKLRAAGMSEQEVFRAVTATPSSILRLSQEIGSLLPGHGADLTIVQWHDRHVELVDVHGTVRRGGSYQLLATIRAGHIIP